MALLLGKEEVNLQSFGSSTVVPSYDVSRLSYFLHCGTQSCNANVIGDPKILDFKHAHTRKYERQNEIFRLASSVYNIETLINKTIFLAKDGDPLLQGSLNKFYKVEKVSSVLAVASQAVIAGKETQVTKIMVCNKEWLEKYYFNPIARNEERIRRITGSQSVDAAALLLSLLAIADEESKHCQHCKGLGSTCACTNGCPRGEHSERVTVHEGVACDSCGESGIRGTRYKCNDCANYDLCKDCYTLGAHDKTHRFLKMSRVGSTVELLSPRQPAIQSSPKVARAVPKDKPSPRSVASLPFAEARPIDVDEFHIGQDVTLINMTDARRNGLRAKVVRSIGKRIVVELVGMNEKITVPPDNLQSASYLIALDTIVELCNLKSQNHRNGELAVVVSNANVAADRVAVRLLDDDSVILSVKPENCDIIADEA